jgi:AraC-like DNA-binding protein
MDVLADLLSRARTRGAVFSDLELPAPWGIEFRRRAPLAFHTVIAGELWAELAGQPPLRLRQGDVVFVRTPEAYRFVHRPGAPALPIAEAQARVTTTGGPTEADADGAARDAISASTRIVCGAYTLQGSVSESVLAALPPLLVVRAHEADAPLRAAVALLSDEVRRAAPGQQTVLDRLLDLLFVYGVRDWFARPQAEPPGWYGALDDPALGAALGAVHAEPAHPWTVAELAARGGLSRAAFARRFRERVGEPPLAYVTRWRMSLASEALTRSPAPLTAIASEVGYASEYAFATAFKREFGESPGRWRREQLAAGPTV